MTSEELKQHYKDMVEQGLFPSIQFEPETLRLKTNSFYINLTDINIRLDDRNSFTFFNGNMPVGWLTLKYPIKDELCKAVFNWLIDIQRWVDKVNCEEKNYFTSTNSYDTVIIDVSQIVSITHTNPKRLHDFEITYQLNNSNACKISYSNVQDMMNDVHVLRHLISMNSDKLGRKNYPGLPPTFFEPQ